MCDHERIVVRKEIRAKRQHVGTGAWHNELTAFVSAGHVERLPGADADGG